ncbi:hypothetical protein IM538_22110 [Cytobacillus suaedae]|nr:hypothetical protein IM538_22110 [Cytobacillus suaedae]
MIHIKQLSKLFILIALVFLIPLTVSAEKGGNNGGVPTQLSNLEAQIQALTSKFEEQQALIHSLQGKVSEQNLVIQEQKVEIDRLYEQLQSQAQEFTNYQESNNIRVDMVQEQAALTATEVNRLDGIIQTVLQQIENIKRVIADFLDPDQTFTVSGQAIYSDGTPISLKEVHVFDSSANGWSNGHTDHNGEFSIDDLENGTYTIKIGEHQNPIAEKQIVVSGNNIHNLLLTATGEVYSIEGVASFANGLPMLSYGIYVTGENGFSLNYGSVEHDGSFQINGVPKGTYTLKFGSRYEPLAEVNVVVEGNVHDLSAVSTYEAVEVKGNMVDSEGKPFMFSHYIEDKDSGVQYARLTSLSDSDGTAVYYLPKNRMYELKIRYEEYTLENPSFSVGTEGIDSITFILTKPTFSVSGTVLDKEGIPVAFEDIVVRYENGPNSGGTYGKSNWRTDSEGNFTLDGLVEGATFKIIADRINASQFVTIEGQDIEGLILQ